MLKVFFDSNEIESKYIRGLSQSSHLFDSEFKLGATLCRSFSLEIAKEGVSNIAPSKVYIKEDTTTKFILYIDSVNDEDDNYYVFSLLDGMIKFNQIYDWSRLNTIQNVTNIVNAMCQEYLGTPGPTIPYLGDMVVEWSQDTLARDFISYVAEVNGGYAYIDSNNNLTFSPYNLSSEQIINVSNCSTFRLGDNIEIDRVVWEVGTASVKIPDDTHYTGTNKTVYVNSSNMLITDSSGYTKEGIVQNIYDKINNFSFYNITVDKYNVNENRRAGQIITFVYGTNIYRTIAQFDWEYNGGWIGGQKLEVNNKQQDETYINSTASQVRKIEIKVDRQLNQITQRVSDAEAQIEVVSGGVIKKVDVLYGQTDKTSTELPTEWYTLAPVWDDNKYMWQRSEVTYQNYEIVYSVPNVIEKAAGKNVYSITELYYCTDNEGEVDIPTSQITEVSDLKYNTWTKVMPKVSSFYTIYHYCSQIEYTDGTYGWTKETTAGGFLSNIKLNDKIKKVTTSVSEVNQRANQIEVRVGEMEVATIPGLDIRTKTLETAVNIQPDGVRITQGTIGSYTLVTADGMEIYAEGNKVAYAKNDGFYAMDYILNGWHMSVANANKSFCFIRKEYN